MSPTKQTGRTGNTMQGLMTMASGGNTVKTKGGRTKNIFGLMRENSEAILQN
jgi:hypothetical protein